MLCIINMNMCTILGISLTVKNNLYVLVTSGYIADNISRQDLCRSATKEAMLPGGLKHFTVSIALYISIVHPSPARRVTQQRLQNTAGCFSSPVVDRNIHRHN